MLAPAVNCPGLVQLPHVQAALGTNAATHYQSTRERRKQALTLGRKYFLLRRSLA